MLVLTFLASYKHLLSPCHLCRSLPSNLVRQRWYFHIELAWRWLRFRDVNVVLSVYQCQFRNCMEMQHRGHVSKFVPQIKSAQSPHVSGFVFLAKELFSCARVGVLTGLPAVRCGSVVPLRIRSRQWYDVPSKSHSVWACPLWWQFSHIRDVWGGLGDKVKIYVF